MRLIIAGSRKGFTRSDVFRGINTWVDSKGSHPSSHHLRLCRRPRTPSPSSTPSSTNIPYYAVPAAWDHYPNKRAGMVRNGIMADLATHLLAFWDGESPGTKDMISKARKNDLDIVVHRL